MANFFKSTFIASILLSSLSASACLDEVSYKLRYKLKSDRPLEVELEETLLAGESLTNDRGHELNTFNEDKLIYSAVGSYHSGWFNAAVAVNPETWQNRLYWLFCSRIKIISTPWPSWPR